MEFIDKDHKGRKRYRNKGGYIILRIKTDETRRNKEGKSRGKATKLILEHRMILEESGIKIPKEHSIHHKNKVKKDNRLENLKLYSSFAVHDKIEHKD